LLDNRGGWERVHLVWEDFSGEKRDLRL
jgi:hypothetical protein